MSTATKKPTAENRLPTCPESHRESIEQFLRYLHRRSIAARNEHRELARTDRSTRVAGQLKHFTKQVQLLEWLLSLNATRRKHA